MSLKEHYDQLQDAEYPKLLFKKEVMDGCDISEASFYRLLSGERRASKLEKAKIAEIAGLSIEKLFPIEENCHENRIA